MKTHTTFTEIRRIMRLHVDGYSTEEIMNEVFIDPEEIKRIIAVKFPKKKSKKAAETT